MVYGGAIDAREVEESMRGDVRVHPKDEEPPKTRNTNENFPCSLFDSHPRILAPQQLLLMPPRWETKEEWRKGIRRREKQRT